MNLMAKQTYVSFCFQLKVCELINGSNKWKTSLNLHLLHDSEYKVEVIALEIK